MSGWHARPQPKASGLADVRVLVTGNLGYIGPRLVQRLLDTGNDVVGLDAGWYADAHVEEIARPEVQHRADVRDLVTDGAGQRQLRHMLEGVGAVVHLAAVSNDPVADLLPSLTHDINFEASARFAHLVRDAGIGRFVFLSTCSVYGDANGEVDETTPPRVLTPYADTKVRMEAVLQRMASSRFLPAILRSATVYGYAPALRLDLIANGMVAWALTTGVVRLISTGDALRPQVHIDDLTDLVVHLLGRDTGSFAEVAGSPLNVGANAANYSIRGLAELIASRVPGANVRMDEGAWVDKRSYRVRFDRLATLVPGVKIRLVEDAVPELVARYRRIGLNASDVRELTYTRLTQLRRLREAGILDEQLRFISSPSATGGPPVAR